MTKASQNPTFDAGGYLDDKESLIQQLNSALDSQDYALVPEVLGHIVTAHGLDQIANDAGITPDSLRKALRDDSDDTGVSLDTIHRVLGALGVELVATPSKHTNGSGSTQHQDQDWPSATDGIPLIGELSWGCW